MAAIAAGLQKNVGVCNSGCGGSGRGTLGKARSKTDGCGGGGCSKAGTLATPNAPAKSAGGGEFGSL